MKLKLPKPRTNEEALKLHREWHEELERQAKLAEAAQAYLQGGEEALRELLRKNNEACEREEEQTQNQTAFISST